MLTTNWVVFTVTLGLSTAGRAVQPLGSLPPPPPSLHSSAPAVQCSATTQQAAGCDASRRCRTHPQDRGPKASRSRVSSSSRSRAQRWLRLTWPIWELSWMLRWREASPMVGTC